MSVTATPSTSRHKSGLIPAALLGLLGLPLILHAGPTSDLPASVYVGGLVAATTFGLLTVRRTGGIERAAAISATVLLDLLCVIQITVWPTPPAHIRTAHHTTVQTLRTNAADGHVDGPSTADTNTKGKR